MRPHIFERFWQAEETARKGRGLGLYIAKGLVEAQGGAIWVDSKPRRGDDVFVHAAARARGRQREAVERAPPGPPVP